MEKPLRIATWNLDHASNSARPVGLQVDAIMAVRPDILVLTETCDEIDLDVHGYVRCTPKDRNKYGKYWTAIHLSERVTRLEELESFKDGVISCVRVQTDLGQLIVYGTILPYRDYKGPDDASGAWKEHYRAIETQGRHWAQLVKEAPLVVAGDFNQTRDNSRGTYGTRIGREVLTRKLGECHLECLTEEDLGAAGKLKADPAKGWPRNNIDHICITRDTCQVVKVGAWDHFIRTGQRVQYLSDHNGVYVDLKAK
jgi:endonuclease/exonuclease/phosphatase family metal-dependent hydrolase